MKEKTDYEKLITIRKETSDLERETYKLKVLNVIINVLIFIAFFLLGFYI